MIKFPIYSKTFWLAHKKRKNRREISARYQLFCLQKLWINSRLQPHSWSLQAPPPELLPPPSRSEESAAAQAAWGLDDLKNYSYWSMQSLEGKIHVELKLFLQKLLGEIYVLDYVRTNWLGSFIVEKKIIHWTTFCFVLGRIKQSLLSPTIPQLIDR